MLKPWIPDLSALPLPEFAVQARDPSRVTLVDNGAGGKAVRLTTLPGDDHIVNSGAMERCDLYQIIPGTLGPVVFGNGTTQWWRHRFMIPDDYPLPNGESAVLFDFHNTGDSAAASMHVDFGNWNQPEWAWGLLQIQRFFGNDPMRPDTLAHVIGRPVRNAWYDCLYNVRWSDKTDGYFRAWVNGKLICMDGGRTLFPGQGVYLKLANYHLPVRGSETLPASVIHDHVIMGATRASVQT